MTSDELLNMARRVQAITQAGLAYCPNPFDVERFEELQALSLQMIEALTDADAPQLVTLFKDEKGYPTPRLGIRAVIEQDDKLLFVKEKTDGHWCLPGGWADVGLSAAENVVKEVREEVGLAVDATRFLAVFDKFKHDHGDRRTLFQTYTLYFHCTITGGELAPGMECSDARYFGMDEIPPLSKIRITEEQVRIIYDRLKNPDVGAFFD